MKNRQKSYWRCIIMNGTKPKFMENLVIAPSYYEQPDPYVNAPSCQFTGTFKICKAMWKKTG